MNKDMTKLFWKIIFGVVLAAVLLYVMIRAVPWQEAKEQMLALRWFHIVLIIGAVIAIGLIKGIRFFVILHFAGISISLKRTVGLFFASQAFTSLPAGEVGRAVLFKTHVGSHLHQLAGPVFLQALLELWTATVWTVGTSFIIGIGQEGWIIPLIVLLFLFSSPLLFSKQIPHFFELLERHGMRYQWIEKMKMSFQNMDALVSAKGKTGRKAFWLSIFSLAFAVHLFSGLLMWYIAGIEGVSLTVVQGIFISAMAALIQGIFTIIPGGIGVTDGGVVGVLTRFSVPFPKALIVTLIYRVAMFPLVVLIGFILLLVPYGKRFLSHSVKHPSL